MKHKIIAVVSLLVVTSGFAFANQPARLEPDPAPSVVDQCAAQVFGCEALRECVGELPEHVTCEHMTRSEARDRGLLQ